MSIRGNIIGLARFIGLLLSLALPHKRYSVRQTKEPDPLGDKLEKFIGPTVSLVAVQPVFCPRCHVQTCWKGKDKGETVVMDNHGNTIRVSNIVVIGKDGKRENGLPVKCPNGHKVVVR